MKNQQIINKKVTSRKSSRKKLVRGSADDFRKWLQRKRLIQEIEQEAQKPFVDDDCDWLDEDKIKKPKPPSAPAKPLAMEDRIAKILESGPKTTTEIAEALGHKNNKSVANVFRENTARFKKVESKLLAGGYNAPLWGLR